MNITDIYSAFRYIGIRSTTMSRFFSHKLMVKHFLI